MFCKIERYRGLFEPLWQKAFRERKQEKKTLSLEQYKRSCEITNKMATKYKW